MKSKKNKKKVLNQRGQGMLEYVMLLAVVAGLVLAFKQPIMERISTLTKGVGDKADQVLQ